MKNPVKISQRFVIDKDDMLGRGSTGNVYAGCEADDYNQKYAVKAIDLSEVTNPVTQYLLSCEIVALTELAKQNTRHIVKLEEILFQDKYCYLVMELLQGGSLADYIRERSQGLGESESIALFVQIFQAYVVIKNQGIIHRDLKPDNLIFRKSWNDNGMNGGQNELCVIDFGYCTKQSVPNRPQVYYNVGSPKYMSPEAFKENKYSEKSDIWALGVILYEMLHGTTIDSGMNMEEYFNEMETKSIQNKRGFSGRVWELLVGMLVYDHNRRFSTEQIGGMLRGMRAVEVQNYNGIKTQSSKIQQYEYREQTPSSQKVQIMQYEANQITFSKPLQNNEQQIIQMVPQLPLNNSHNQNAFHVQRRKVQLNSHRSEPVDNYQQISYVQSPINQRPSQVIYQSQIFPQQNLQRGMVKSPSNMIHLHQNQQSIMHFQPHFHINQSPNFMSVNQQNRYFGDKADNLEKMQIQNYENTLKRQNQIRNNSSEKFRKMNGNQVLEANKFETVFVQRRGNQIVKSHGERVVFHQIKNPSMIEGPKLLMKGPVISQQRGLIQSAIFHNGPQIHQLSIPNKSMQMERGNVSDSHVVQADISQVRSDIVIMNSLVNQQNDRRVNFPMQKSVSTDKINPQFDNNNVHGSIKMQQINSFGLDFNIPRDLRASLPVGMNISSQNNNITGAPVNEIKNVPRQSFKIFSQFQNVHNNPNESHCKTPAVYFSQSKFQQSFDINNQTLNFPKTTPFSTQMVNKSAEQIKIVNGGTLVRFNGNESRVNNVIGESHVGMKPNGGQMFGQNERSLGANQTLNVNQHHQPGQNIYHRQQVFIQNHPVNPQNMVQQHNLPGRINKIQMNNNSTMGNVSSYPSSGSNFYAPVTKQPLQVRDMRFNHPVQHNKVFQRVIRSVPLQQQKQIGFYHPPQPNIVYTPNPGHFQQGVNVRNGHFMNQSIPTRDNPQIVYNFNPVVQGVRN